MLDRFTTPHHAGDARPRILADEDPFQVPAFPNEDVYLYVKHIDNSRVLREADPAARQICWRLIGSSFAFAVVVIALLLPSLNRLMAGYKMEALRQERQRLELDRASLELAGDQAAEPGASGRAGSDAALRRPGAGSGGLSGWQQERSNPGEEITEPRP